MPDGQRQLLLIDPEVDRRRARSTDVVAPPEAVDPVEVVVAIEIPCGPSSGTDVAAEIGRHVEALVGAAGDCALGCGFDIDRTCTLLEEAVRELLFVERGPFEQERTR